MTDEGGLAHRTVAGLVRDGPRILLVHRSASRTWFPDVWDLPGGHVEPGESPAAALVRELREALGIEVDRPDGPELMRLEGTDYDGACWIVERWAGIPANRAPDEHDDLAWFGVEDLTDLSLADQTYPDLIRRALGAADFWRPGLGVECATTRQARTRSFSEEVGIGCAPGRRRHQQPGRLST